MNGVILSVFGVMLALTPAIMIVMAGVQSEDDFIRWITDQPLQFIFALKAMMTTGVGLIIAGAALYYLPS